MNVVCQKCHYANLVRDTDQVVDLTQEKAVLEIEVGALREKRDRLAGHLRDAQVEIATLQRHLEECRAVGAREREKLLLLRSSVEQFLGLLTDRGVLDGRSSVVMSLREAAR